MTVATVTTGWRGRELEQAQRDDGGAGLPEHGGAIGGDEGEELARGGDGLVGDGGDRSDDRAVDAEVCDSPSRAVAFDVAWQQALTPKRNKTRTLPSERMDRALT
jgi:hypothetical protein